MSLKRTHTCHIPRNTGHPIKIEIAENTSGNAYLLSVKEKVINILVAEKAQRRKNSKNNQTNERIELKI